MLGKDGTADLVQAAGFLSYSVLIDLFIILYFPLFSFYLSLSTGKDASIHL